MIDLTAYAPIEGESMYQPNPLTLALAPWSISRAKTGARCALQYHWQYLEKRTGDPDLERADDSMRIGSAMHQIYEDMLKGDTNMSSIYERAATANTLSVNERETMEELYKNIPWFQENIFALIRDKVLPPGHNASLMSLVRDGYIGIEKKFALTRDMQASPDFFNNKGQTFLRGVIDVILLTNDGGAVVLDHKSARFSGNMGIYTEQLRAYAVAILKMYPQVQWVHTGIHFMALKEVKFRDPVTRKDLPGEERALNHFLSSCANNILVKEFNVGNHCKWCSYKTSCKKLRKEVRKKKREEAKAAKAKEEQN